MIKNKIKVFFLAGILLTILPQNSHADYSYSVDEIIPESVPSSNSSTFSITKDSATCSSGGGSVPSLWLGAKTGNGDTNGGDLTKDETNDFLTGGVGFVIPLGRKYSSNCKNLLSILELQELLLIIDSLNEMGVIDQSKIATVIQNYMKKVSKDLGVDLYSAIKPNSKLLIITDQSDDDSISNDGTSSDD